MKKSLAIIGGGSCALMLACEIDTSIYEVSIYERNPAPARKFLVAGQGGLNITHSEAPSSFIQNYTPSAFLAPSFSRFNNQHLVNWLHEKGIETYEGSSGRIFPAERFKPVDVLNKLMDHAQKKGCRFHYHTLWKGFDEDGSLIMENKEKGFKLSPEICIFCLGGASWPVTGSKGEWTEYFVSRGIRVHPFEASNCTFLVNWPQDIVGRMEGKALKNISITCGDKTVKGEVVITRTGLEGSGIYPLSPLIRRQLKSTGNAGVKIDLKPQHSEQQLLKKLGQTRGGSYTEKIKRGLNLPGFCIQLLKALVPKEDFLDAASLVKHIKSLPIPIYAAGPIEDAISTAGGISLGEVNEHFELKKMPGHYAIGEMLDYDAPTGGYLLQSCFTMAYDLAVHINGKN